jgi:protein-L-isoaspartate(D-aspartate) O-methyltransferase
MVKRYVADKGIKDERILRAMREVPRHLFVPTLVAAQAYGAVDMPMG